MTRITYWRSLCFRVPALVFVLFLLLAIGFMRGLDFVVRQSYEDFETRQVTRDVARARAGLRSFEGHLRTSVGDWAPWDDTYRFMSGAEPGYLASNLGVSSLTNIHVDFIAFERFDRTVVASEAIDPVTHAPTGFPDAAFTGYATLLASLNHANPDSVASGLVALPRGPALVAARVITNTDRNMPPNGVLVMGRYISDDEAADLKRLTVLDVKLLEVPPDSEVEPNKVDVTFASTASVVGRVVLEDVQGRPVLAISVDRPREGLGYALRTLTYAGWSLMAFVVLFGIGMSVTLELSVLRRVARLHAQVSSIGSAGRRRWNVEVHGSDELAELAVGLNSALRRLEETELALQHAADHDPLTDVANRRRFEQDAVRELEERRREGGSCSLVLLDADEFKSINDTYGHHSGDKVLVWLARTLRSTMRSYASVARLGGDEFAVLMPHTGREAAQAAVERLVSRLELGVCMCDGEAIRVGVSTGVATSPEDGESLEELITSADRALYASKGPRPRGT